MMCNGVHLIRLFRHPRFLIPLVVACLLVLMPVVGWCKKDGLVAVVITGDLPRYQLAHEAFVHKLEELTEARGEVTVYVQRPNPDVMSWINSIRKAVGIGADIIVTYGAPATLAGKNEGRNIPIVFADVYEPVALGIVADIAKPGGNLTGMAGQTPLETLLHAYYLSKDVRKIGVLFSPEDQASIYQKNKLVEIAEKKGITVLPAEVNGPGDLWKELQTLSPHIDSLFVAESAVLEMSATKIMDFSKKNKIPVISQIHGFCEMGALMTLEADPAEQGSRIAGYVAEILSGKKPGELPVRTPRNVSLVINLHAARELGLKIPFQALTLATRVIR